ncbi:MAG: serine/threonine-protein kinase, partial [Planctomycetota bacterium]
MPARESMSGLIGNRYRIEEVIGSGGMGEVYRVTDLLREGKVKALKTLPPDLLSEGILERFKIEFEILASLSHPGLEEVHDFEFDSDRGINYFTAEYIPGNDFLSAAEGLNFADLASLTVQVCRALAYLHSRGIIHFDLKPGNVLVSPDRAGVKLIDFGLAGAKATELFGTPGYVAPEIIRDGEADRRADLYGLGVILYQVVTGEFPFRSRSSASIVLRQMEEQPLSPGRLNPRIPEPLARIILKLIEREPSNRFSSAQDVILAINDGLGTEYDVEVPATVEGYVLSSRLVGRDEEMAKLQERFFAAVSSEAGTTGKVPGMILVSGEGGGGKKRLLREFRCFVQLRGAAFIEGSHDPDATGPAGILAETLRSLSALGGSWKPSPSTGEISPPFEKAVRRLAEVSTRHPFVLHLRDIHTFGTGQGQQLGLLVRSVNLWRREAGDAESRPRLLIVATADSCQLDENPYMEASLRDLDSMDLVEKFRLAPLDGDHVRELVESAIGTGLAARSLSEGLYAELGGNPLAVIEALKFLLEEGVLAFGTHGWTVDQSALGRPGGIPTVSRALELRAGHLPPERRRILEALAVVESPSDPHLIGSVLGEEPRGVLREMMALEKSGFVHARSGGEGGCFEPVHAMLREIIYESTETKRRKELHARTATLLESDLEPGKDSD